VPNLGRAGYATVGLDVILTASLWLMGSTAPGILLYGERDDGDQDGGGHQSTSSSFAHALQASQLF
jgi:hypothetical protein